MSLSVIIDYKVGNLHNLKNALDYLKLPVAIVEEPEAVRQADRILFPGVGAFGPAMQHLRDSGLLEVMEEKVQSGTPLLGICVGAQLLMDLGQENGPHQGLGWIAGEVSRFEHQLKVPQIGWNEVELRKPDPLFQGLRNGSYFYFVHSYHLRPNDLEVVLGETEYGYPFASAVRNDNVWGVQFHPEKSQQAGLQLLQNFCTLT